MLVMDKATGQTSSKEVTLSRDEGNRPDTTLEGLKALTQHHLEESKETCLRAVAERQ